MWLVSSTTADCSAASSCMIGGLSICEGHFLKLFIRYCRGDCIVSNSLFGDTFFVIFFCCCYKNKIEGLNMVGNSKAFEPFTLLTNSVFSQTLCPCFWWTCCNDLEPIPKKFTMISYKNRLQSLWISDKANTIPVQDKALSKPPKVSALLGRIGDI